MKGAKMNRIFTLSLVGLTAIGLAGCAPVSEQDELSTSAAAIESVEGESTTEATEVTTETMEVEGEEAEEASGTNETTTVTKTNDIGQLATEDTTTELLSYLIEEEKLAHDVYTVMYDLYGAKVFGNILESESTHQDKVADLLDAYGVKDPRSDELGEFNDPELQNLYDQLIAIGSESEEAAYQVGVMIEEKDIADITSQLATASDAAVVEVLEKLRSGSENHLRAFNKQL
jgi:hypothetical protein